MTQSSPIAATAPSVRESGTASVGGWWSVPDEETTPELQWPRSVAVFDLMRRQDAQVASVLRAVKLPVRRTTWRLDGRGCRDEVTRFVADDLRLPIVGEDVNAPPPGRAKGRFAWSEHLSTALLCLDYGHMFFEQTYRYDAAANRYHLRKLGPRMPRTLSRVNVADDGGLASIEQNARTGPGLVAGRGGSVTIPVEHLVAYVHEREGGAWLGNSVLRPAYKNWLVKDELLRVWAQTIKRNGMGVPVYTAQAGASTADVEAGTELAQSYRAGDSSGAGLPNGATLELMGVSGTLPDADPAIRYQDEQIARSVLAHFLNLGTQTGSWALGSTFADFFTQGLQTVAELVCDTANQHIVEDLVDVNWGPDEPAPHIVFDEIGKQEGLTATVLKMLADGGVIIPDRALEEEMRRRVGLPPKALPSPPSPVPAPTS